MPTQLNQDQTVEYTDGVPLPTDNRFEPLLNAWDIKWGGAVGQGVTLTYSFPGSGAEWRVNYSDDQEYLDMTNLNVAQQAAVVAALETWSDVANLTFELKVDSTSDVKDVAILRFAIFDGMDDAAGWGYLPGYYSSSGDVWLDPVSFVDPAELEPGSYGFATLIHEIGHALGLNHPNDNGMEPGFDARTTVMSYRSHPFSVFYEDVGGGQYVGYTIEPDTPMPKDILAIQYLYGANMEHATGDDLYTFDPETPFIRTIWDAGGNDTISVSNFSLGCKIDLGAGKFSSIKGPETPLPEFLQDEPGLYDGRQNLAIAYKVTIENAIGGAGNDNLVGNGAANVLTGNDGNDKLDGKGGTDELAGGNGNDKYTIDSDTEIDTGLADAGTDIVNSKVTYALGDEQEKLTLLGSAAINGTGNDAANVLKGNGAVNTLDGAGGDDVLSGGIGKDILTGGAGADIFRFDSKIGAGNVDRIMDFTPEDGDVLYLSDAIFLRLRAAIRDETGGGPVEIRPGEFQAVAGGKAVDAGDRIIYNTNNGALFYDPDGSGSKAPIKIAMLDGAPSLTVDDILVYAG